jgi:hypothetical protein
MTWDYAEGNPFSSSSGNFLVSLDWIRRCFAYFPAGPAGYSAQADASSQVNSAGKLVSTDPPYYDNISYADLAAFNAYNADPDIIDLMALTNGRAFSLRYTPTPSPWNRGRYAATITLRQIGRM